MRCYIDICVVILFFSFFLRDVINTKGGKSVCIKLVCFC